MADNQIESPDERTKILRDKAAREGIPVPEDVLDYIASKYATPHALKSALVQVMMEAARRQRLIDMAIARRALGDAPLPVAQEASLPPAPEAAALEESLIAEAPPEVDAPSQDPEAAVLELLDEPQPDIPEPDYPVDLFGYDDTGIAIPDDAPAPAHAVPAYVDESESAPEQSAPAEPHASEPAPESRVPQPAPAVVAGSQPQAPARVYFAPIRTQTKKSLVDRTGMLLKRAGLGSAIQEGDIVAVKMHFGEQGNTGFVQPIFVREVVARIKEAGGKPFLTDSNTLYRGERANAVDHIACALHNGFSYATVEAPVIIADGLSGRDAVDVPVEGLHFDSVRIGAAAVHADAMVVVTHVKGHEATGFGGALKNVGMGLGSRSAKQRMHADFKPETDHEQCNACGRCEKWCPVGAISIGPDRVVRIDYDICYGCGECVAACAYGAIATQWKTEPEAIQEKIVEHVAGAVAGKEGKVVYLSFVMNVSPDCDCWNFSDAGVVADIGVLASTDVVAIEQAAVDLITGAVGLTGTRGEGLVAGVEKFKAITGVDGNRAIEYAEEMGLGSRAYDLVHVG
ncbi:MAG: DUF362 domain-containing protein [Coriobacteriia bacterium]